MIDKNKVLFSTSEGLMKMVVFKAEVFKDTVVYDRHQYNTQSKIKGFQFLDENAKNIISVDELVAAFVVVYLANGRKLYLDEELKLITLGGIRREVEINKVVETTW